MKEWFSAGKLAISGDIFSSINLGRGGCYWHPADKAHYITLCNVQDSLHKKN
jgi:hypothetical protein